VDFDRSLLICLFVSSRLVSSRLVSSRPRYLPLWNDLRSATTFNEHRVRTNVDWIQSNLRVEMAPFFLSYEERKPNERTSRASISRSRVYTRIYTNIHEYTRIYTSIHEYTWVRVYVRGITSSYSANDSSNVHRYERQCWEFRVHGIRNVVLCLRVGIKLQIRANTVITTVHCLMSYRFISDGNVSGK